MAYKIWSPILKLIGVAFILELAFWFARFAKCSSFIRDIVSGLLKRFYE